MEKKQKIIQTFASLFFILIIVVPALDHRFHWSDVPIPFVLVGDIFVLLGLLIVFLVFKENNYAAGFVPLALGSWWGVVFVFPMFVVLVLRLLEEEKFLSKSLPGYKEYYQKTRYRLVPFLW